ncbi:ABC transporter ATP-binding protein [Thalassotalea fusca]
MIEVKDICKTFQLSKEALKSSKKDVLDVRQEGRAFHALKGVSFSCAQGEVLGLLGPNGAGKTTILRILASALKPTSGDITIAGESVVTKPALSKQKIGFLSGKTGLYNRLTARENIEYFARLHGLSKQRIRDAGEHLYAQLGIEPYLDRRVETLSTGMTQKVSIARAVIHQPEVIIFDEPTTGLDIMATEVILEFIESQKQRGVSVIFSTHHLDEVAMLADKITVINDGTTRFCGTLAQFTSQSNEVDLRKAFKHFLSSDEDVLCG